jgi:phosphate transport system substrate-binding protein
MNFSKILDRSGRLFPVPILLTLLVLVAGCGDGTNSGNPSAVSGSLLIDGSSTAFPIAEAIADDFMRQNPGARVSVASTGTGSGMDKFGRGEIEVATASRVIKPEEVQQLENEGIEFIEVPVAFDGITIMVNPQNDWMTEISMEQLREIWRPGSTIQRWNQIDSSFPDQPINLYGPTSVHGTFEYFNEVVNGDGKSTRTDFAQMADYQQLLQGVSRDQYALGYAGYAYYEENPDIVRALPVSVDGRPAVKPSPDTIANGEYTPLARPLVFYVRKDALEDNPLILPVFEYLFSPPGAEAIADTGYIPLPEPIQVLALARLTGRTTGTVLITATPGTPLADVLRKAESE